MDNQHRKISGYRELTETQITLMNEIKAEGPRLEALIERLQSYAMNGASDAYPDDGNIQPRGETLRWISIGQTHLQQGLMALTRGVAKPTFF
jgi:hypothetical protein